MKHGGFRMVTSQIRDKKGRKKGIETKNPINAKSVQLTRAARFCSRFSSIYLSESFDFLKVRILYIVTLFALVIVSLLASITLGTGTALCTALSVHLSTGSLESCVQF